MLNLLLTLSLGIIIGWSLHSFFNKLGSPNIIRNDINISINKNPPLKIEAKKTILAEQNISKEKIQIALKRDTKTDNFYRLLNKGLFSDAMALYSDAPEKKLIQYRLKLLEYFQKKVKTDITLAITQMQEFIELEPEHYDISILLIKTLSSSQKEHELVNFLEEQIAQSDSSTFYIYQLANYYIQKENFTKAKELLKEIEFDEKFAEKAKVLLEQLEKKKKIEYTYKIPLKKSGDHFTINISIDETPLTLILDTGATITMVNEEKLPYLTILKENITLQTAGGEIEAKLQEAQNLSIGELELKKFRLVSSSFEQKDADGLLGMNFFKRFKFKIDQENKLLYLSKKEINGD